MLLHFFISFLSFTNSIFFKLIDEAISEIEAGQKPSEITFLTELLKQPDLKRDEVIILTSSLFMDSLSTVSGLHEPALFVITS